MIYTAALASKTNPTNATFESKGLGVYGMTSMSKLNISAKPNFPQVAYAGYAGTIEAFIHATAVRSKVIVSKNHAYPIPVDYIPSLPMHSPATVAGFATEPSTTTKEKLMGVWRKYNAKFESIKKGDTVLYFENVPYSEVARVFAAFKDGIRADSKALPSGVFWYFHIVKCIDAFLATHTYYFKENDESKNKEGLIYPGMEQRGGAWYRDGFSAKKSKTSESEERRAKYVDEEEKMDLTPDTDTLTHKADGWLNEVFIAKPSKYPSTVNWGLPSEVPNASGILFPYFHGLIAGDSAFVRDVITRRFFRNLGGDPREAYRSFRKEFGTFPNTAHGKALTHILLGVDLALTAQARLYLLFSEDQYLGYVLLGEAFKVYINGEWVSPATPEDLAVELQSIQTYDSQLEKLAALLTLAGTVDKSDVEYTKGDLMSTYALSQALAKLSLEDKKIYADVEKLVGQLRFPRRYRTLNPANVSDAISALANRTPFMAGEIFVSPTDFAKMAKPEYSVFASFGPTAFSFITEGGDVVKLGNSAFGVGDESTRRKIILYHKKVYQCMDDWVKVKKTRSVQAKFGERAALSRAAVFTSADMMTIVQALDVATEVSMEDDDEDEVVAPKKTIAAMAMGGASLDDLF
jgi:hypothetical protein